MCSRAIYRTAISRSDSTNPRASPACRHCRVQRWRRRRFMLLFCRQSLTLKPAARLNPVEITVNVELQQNGGMIRRPPRYLGGDPVKSQRRQIEFIDKDVDHLNRIVLVDLVCQAFRKQRRLPAINPLNEALHAILRSSRITLRSESQIPRFYTARVNLCRTLLAQTLL